MNARTRVIGAAKWAALILATILITLLLMTLSQASGGFAADALEGSTPAISLAIAVHLATALPALLLGPVILFNRKGDRRHRWLGRIWVGLMMVTAVASAFIRSPGTGIAGTGFSFIHLFTIWTLIGVPLAVFAIRAGDIKGHRTAMIGLYFGLVVAGAFTLIPGRLLGNWLFG